MKYLTYEETIELEKNVAIKKEAEEIYETFMKLYKFKASDYKEGKFLHWKDSCNAAYIAINNQGMTYQCRFLHETYDVVINPSSLFRYIKESYRGYDHFKSLVRSLVKKEEA